MTRAAGTVRLVADRCRGDERVQAALTYGSVPQRLDDDFSDAEFWIFVTDEGADWTAWIRSLAPVTHLIDNEFGATVAFRPGGFRCEFHIRPVEAIPEVLLWPGRGAPVAEMVLVDRDGELTAALSTVPMTAGSEAASLVCGRFANWWLLGWNVLRRGEYERALDALAHVRRHLLWMARLRTGATERWLTPSRLAERDLPAADLDRLRLLIGSTEPAQLRESFARAWAIGRDWWAGLDGAVPAALSADIAELLTAGSPPADPSAG